MHGSDGFSKIYEFNEGFTKAVKNWEKQKLVISQSMQYNTCAAQRRRSDYAYLYPHICTKTQDVQKLYGILWKKSYEFLKMREIN